MDSDRQNNEGFDSKTHLDNYNTWYHVALVYYEGYQLLFVDGKLDSQMDVKSIKRIDNQNFHIFCSPHGYSRGNLEVKYFRMYDMALTQTDVQLDMKQDEPLTVVTPLVPKNESNDSLLRRDMKKMLTMEEFSNVILVFPDQRTIKANDIILSTRSEYFRKLLSKEWNDGKIEFTPKNPKKIDVEFMSYETMSIVMQYIYTGQLDDESNEYSVQVLLGVLKAGNVLLLTEMENMVTGVLTSYIDSSNVCQILNEIYAYNVSSLNTYCVDYISKKFKQVPTETFLQMEKEIQQQVLDKLKMRM